MKILSKLMIWAMLVAGVSGARAQSLGEAVILSPFPPTPYQTFLQTVTVAYNYEMITLADEDLMVLVKIGDRHFEVYADVYFDSELAAELNQTQKGDAWGNELIIDFSEEVYSIEYPVGEYTIYLPEGLVKNENGDTNASQTISFIKVDPVAPVSVSPADGMHTPEQLKDVSITFNDPIQVIEGTGLLIEIREKNDWIGMPYYIENYRISDDGKSLLFDLSNLSRGVLYSVMVPKGFVKVGDLAVNSEVWLEYMNWDGMHQATIVSAPDPNSTYDSLNPFILTWDRQPITISADAPDTEFVCGFPDYGFLNGWRIWIPASYYELVYIDENGEVDYNTSPDTPANAVYLDVKEFVEDFAGYQFEIFFPAALVVNNQGLDNPPLSYLFDVRNLWIDPEVSAENGVITISWPYAENVAYNLLDEEITLTDAAGVTTDLNFGGNNPVTMINDDNEHGLKINLNKIELPNGTYTLVVPQGYVNIQGADSDEFIFNDTFQYKFSWENGDFTAITGIQIENSLPIVYNLEGKRINISNLNALNKGIYIVNGKKILIK